jgi:hypothetical protein
VRLLQKKYVVIQPFITTNKTKENLKKIKTLQEKCIAYEAIKIVSGKMT